jgi:hypothetical protein
MSQPQDSVTDDEKPTAEKSPSMAPDASADDGEFKITVRKLEMPVRPRGVLAE